MPEGPIGKIGVTPSPLPMLIGFGQSWKPMKARKYLDLMMLQNLEKSKRLSVTTVNGCVFTIPESMRHPVSIV